MTKQMRSNEESKLMQSKILTFIKGYRVKNGFLWGSYIHGHHIIGPRYKLSQIHITSSGITFI